MQDAEDDEMENYSSGLKFLFLQIKKRTLPLSSVTDLQKDLPFHSDQVKTTRDLPL